ncbi:PDZ domain-containing protein [Gracilibacillus kekensis]|uniref:PDZ domain-containing protein n=1 Tax=Gracilibacillus kekensis TaxID=1027249 RepID=A0A1M7MXI1_9BACI|nr:PDZ domain-containing protein [Gracilibacillus kekensis]SHM95798.1 hypothetical protein SAMN05216179_1414 [Gracilibacillus kekensis]
MDWMIEIGLAFARIFMQPFIYLFFLIILISGYRRIKKDRKSFGSKVYPYFYETKNTWSIAIVIGLLLSGLSIAFGFMVSIHFSLLVGLIIFVIAITNRFSWLSAGDVLAISAAVMYFINVYGEGYIQMSWINSLDVTDLFYIPFLVVIFLLAETWYLARVDGSDTFPELVKSNRGKNLGQHRIKKLTIIPFVALFPAGVIEPYADWWPIFEIGETSFGLIVIPYLFGFEYITKSMLPQTASNWLAKRIALLALVVLTLAIGGFFVPILTVIALATGFLGKEIIQYFYRTLELKNPAYFQPASKGLLVLGTLPNTPAVDLGLIPGERIIKVNDRVVENEQQYYQAINENRAFCKLAIKDLNGETRFAQRALYEGEHHKLGILFVSEIESYTQLKQES